MRILSFYLILFLLSTPAISQQVMNLEWGEDHDFDRSLDYNEVVGIKDGKIYVLSTSGFKARNSINVNLDVYDENTMSLMKRIGLVENKSDHNFEDLIITAEKILVFTSYFDRELGLKILTSQEYVEETNSLVEYQRVDEVQSDPKDDIHFFHIAASPNGNYVMIYHDNPSESGYKVFNLKVINYDHTSLWEKEISLNYKRKMVEFTDMLIDNGGNIYMLSTINPFGLKKTSGLGNLVNIKSTLFVYRPYDDKLKEFEFALSRNWIDQVKIRFDDAQNLIATAFYTYPNDYKIRGFVMFELNGVSGEVSSRKMNTLDKVQFKKIDASISRLKSSSRDLVGSPGIYPGSSSHMNSTSTEFITRDVVVSEDRIVVAVEAFRRDERCTESFSDQQMIVNCQKHFLYGDVILFYMNRDCEVLKIKNVRKIQHSVDKLSPYFSFDVVENNHGLFVFYNEDYRNFGAEASDRIPLSNMNKATLNIKAFDPSGSEMDLAFKVNTEGRIPFFPRGNLRISERHFLLYSQREKNYKFGKLSIQ